METTTMGKVVVPARIENLGDLLNARQGLIQPQQVRAVDVPDAVVDTAASTPSLPRRLIQQLGLQPMRTRQARTAAGAVTLQMYAAVRLTVQGRDCSCDVLEVADECPVLIGQIPLEMMDWVIDPSGRRLVGNPEHGGEHILELY